MKFLDYFDGTDKKKRMSHALNLMSLAKSDGNFADIEINLVNRICQEYGITLDEYKRILERPESIKFHPPDSTNERLLQLFELVQVMLIDGEIDDKELEFCKSVAIKLGFNAKIIDDIILKIINLIIENTDKTNLQSELNKIIKNKDMFEQKKLLINSVQNFNKKNNRLPSSTELEAEVINCTCLFILRHKYHTLRQVHDIGLINTVFFDNLREFKEIAVKFTTAATELFPSNYNKELAESAYILIIQNISWAGMWDFLRSYYIEKHGINIDEKKVHSKIFISKKHDRLENNIKVSDASVERIIKVDFIENSNKMLIEIQPSISPKTTNLVSVTDNSKKYKGDDPDFEFTLYFNTSGEIFKVEFERKDKNVKWIYT